jgi:hypothetical protein
VRLSLRKAACSSMAPPSSTGNPGSVYTNCETALAVVELPRNGVSGNLPLVERLSIFTSTLHSQVQRSAAFCAQVAKARCVAAIDRRGGALLQERHYDFNIRNQRQFGKKLRYIHRNPLKRGLCEHPGDWEWSSFRNYAMGIEGRVKNESEWAARNREHEAELPHSSQKKA